MNEEESLCFFRVQFSALNTQSVINEHFRGTQPTVSVDICSEENLLSPTIFGLKYDEKLEYSLAQNLVVWRK